MFPVQYAAVSNLSGQSNSVRKISGFVSSNDKEILKEYLGKKIQIFRKSTD